MNYPYKRKIINDPIYGQITVKDTLILNVLNHPYFQRLRRIHQVALAAYVYPGCVHSRLQHALGAYHLMTLALQELVEKNIPISQEEIQAAEIAILLHDIGHGPFSHALEYQWGKAISHEAIGKIIMSKMNQSMHGALDLALQIFENKYPRKFFHQLVSGQLDMDRMDYLTRDSFFTGVNEGIIGYNRILKMLNVVDDNLVIEEKGIFSIEKFLLARHQMYAQVYLHKNVLAAEIMLKTVLKRARSLYPQHKNELEIGSALDFFLFDNQKNEDLFIEKYCQLDDIDIVFALKKWSHHPDKVLHLVANKLLDRNLFKISFPPHPLSVIEKKKSIIQLADKYRVPLEAAEFLCIEGSLHDHPIYTADEEHIRILKSNGQVANLSTFDNTLISQLNCVPSIKYYICWAE